MCRRCRLRRSVSCGSLDGLRKRLHRVGVEKLPPGLRVEVGSLSDLVELLVAIGHKVIGHDK
jgi:hypothetical protein